MPGLLFCVVLYSGMNAAVRAVTRMGIYVGAKVYLIHEVNRLLYCVFIHVNLLNTLIQAFIIA